MQQGPPQQPPQGFNPRSNSGQARPPMQPQQMQPPPQHMQPPPQQMQPQFQQQQGPVMTGPWGPGQGPVAQMLASGQSGTVNIVTTTEEHCHPGQEPPPQQVQGYPHVHCHDMPPSHQAGQMQVQEQGPPQHFHDQGHHHHHQHQQIQITQTQTEQGYPPRGQSGPVRQAEQSNAELAHAHGAAQSTGNKIRIHLHSQTADGQCDSMASVVVDCDNPDAVVHRMLDKLADKFPPESIVTIEKEICTDLPHEHPESEGYPNVTSRDIDISNLQHQHSHPHSHPHQHQHSHPQQQQQQPQQFQQQPQQFQQQPQQFQQQPQQFQQQPQQFQQQPQQFQQQEVEVSQKYSEMPLVEEVEIQVPVPEVRYVERAVPKYVTQYRDVIKEVPEIRYTDVYKEVEQVQEVIKYVPVKQVVDKYVENIVHRSKIEVRQVEKRVEIPARDGRIQEVQKPYTVEQREVVAVFKDTLVPCVVSQKLMPIIQQSNDEIEVEAKKYIPYLVPVDVYVPRPVQVPLIPLTKTPTTDHCPVQVPPAQFNTLLLDINPQLRDEKEKFLPTIRAPDGTIPLMPGTEPLTLNFEMHPSQVQDMPHMQHVQENSQPVTMPLQPVYGQGMEQHQHQQHQSAHVYQQETKIQVQGGQPMPPQYPQHQFQPSGQMQYQPPSGQMKPRETSQPRKMTPQQMPQPQMQQYPPTVEVMPPNQGMQQQYPPQGQQQYPAGGMQQYPAYPAQVQ